MNANQFKKLLTGYLKRKLNKADHSLLQNWYDSFGDDEAGVPGLGNPREEEILKDDLFNRIQVKLNQPKRPVFRLQIFIRNMAAVLIVIVSVGFAAWFFNRKSQQDLQLTENTFQTITTNSGQIKKLLLPDSSIVHLNANSRIRIPMRFSKTDRQFFLEEGEAFFEVAKDKKRPFIIHSQQLDVKVLGTSFNVRSYSKLENIKVAVTTGSVSVSEVNKVYAVLKPGEIINYHKNNKTVSRTLTNQRDNNAWVKGRIYLEKAGFDELAIALKNIYGITLLSTNIKAQNYQYNLTIRSDRTLEETMGLVCAIHGNHYRRKGNEILIQ